VVSEKESSVLLQPSALHLTSRLSQEDQASLISLFGILYHGTIAENY